MQACCRGAYGNVRRRQQPGETAEAAAQQLAMSVAEAVAVGLPADTPADGRDGDQYLALCLAIKVIRAPECGQDLP